MADFTMLQPFVEALAEKAHNLGSDSLKIALCSSSNAPDLTDAQLSNITEITYTNLSSRAVTTISSAQTTGIYKLVLQDLTLTASGGSVAGFRYVVLYNDTSAGDQLIAYWDRGSDITLADGESLTLDFDGTDGVLEIGVGTIS